MLYKWQLNDFIQQKKNIPVALSLSEPGDGMTNNASLLLNQILFKTFDYKNGLLNFNDSAHFSQFVFQLFRLLFR